MRTIYRSFNGCSSGKTPYRTKSEAKRGLKKTQQFGVRVTRVYRCPECDWWHLTSQRVLPWRRTHKEAA